MAKARIGHFMEARILEALGVDYIDESEVLTPADEEHHIDKHDFKVPFVCGARNLGEALRRIGEGAAMIRTKGEAGSGNIVEAVRHMRTIVKEMKQLTVLGKEELMAEAKKLRRPYELVRVGRGARQAAGAELLGGRHRHAGRRRARDAARRRGGVRRLRHLQVVRSGKRGPSAIVKATTHYNDPDVLLEASEELGDGHAGLDICEAGREASCCRRAAGNGARMKIGVLALQGDFAAHAAALGARGAARRSRCASPSSSRGSTG